MTEIKVNDKVRWKGAAGGQVVGTVNIVRDYNGNAHVRFPDDIGMVVVTSEELLPVTDDDVEH